MATAAKLSYAGHLLIELRPDTPNGSKFEGEVRVSSVAANLDEHAGTVEHDSALPRRLSHHDYFAKSPTTRPG